MPRSPPGASGLSGKRALLYTGGVKAWSVVSALQDLGMEVVATSTRKSTEDDKAKIRELMGENTRMLDESQGPRALIDMVHETETDVLIAGGRNMYTALKARLPFLHINQEREHAYAGYEGMITFARQLAQTIESPIWDAVRRPAPWDAAGGRGGSGVGAMAEIVKRNKALAVSPLKASQTMGAALAFLGIKDTIAMLHGAQGCTAYGKIFLIGHFREPMPLQTTAMDQVSTVIGRRPERRRRPCDPVRQGFPPVLVGLPTTGLAETEGSDTAGSVNVFRKKHPEHDGTAIVAVETPDYAGSLEAGFAKAVTAMIDKLVPEADAKGGDPASRRVTILVNGSLSPGDIEEVKEIVEAFGLEPIVLPDLSGSLDGHLADADYSPLTDRRHGHRRILPPP